LLFKAQSKFRFLLFYNSCKWRATSKGVNFSCVAIIIYVRPSNSGKFRRRRNRWIIGRIYRRSCARNSSAHTTMIASSAKPRFREFAK